MFNVGTCPTLRLDILLPVHSRELISYYIFAYNINDNGFKSKNLSKKTKSGHFFFNKTKVITVWTTLNRYPHGFERIPSSSSCPYLTFWGAHVSSCTPVSRHIRTHSRTYLTCILLPMNNDSDSNLFFNLPFLCQAKGPLKFLFINA